MEEEPARLQNRQIPVVFVVAKRKPNQSATIYEKKRLAKSSGGLHYFFFLNHPTVNRIPIRNAGPAIMRDQDNIYHSNGFIISKMIYNNPARIKAIPPTISCFQEINRTANKISDGIL